MPTTFIYIRGKCTTCDQRDVYGWQTTYLFTCCACHDLNDTEDTRPVLGNSVGSIPITGYYMIENGPESPRSVVSV